MNTKVIVAVLVGLIVGAGGALALTGDKTTPVASTETPRPMQGSNSSMMTALEGKQGDEFDKAFIAQMTIHHQGAIQMAELALLNAKRPEIKKMAQDIISAQKTEIEQMQGWQASWYGMPQPGAAMRNDQ